MLHVNWFVNTMKRTFNVEVIRHEVSYESYDFYHDELDDLLVPAEHLEKRCFLKRSPLWMMRAMNGLQESCWKSEGGTSCMKCG